MTRAWPKRIAEEQTARVIVPEGLDQATRESTEAGAPRRRRATVPPRPWKSLRAFVSIPVGAFVVRPRCSRRMRGNGQVVGDVQGEVVGGSEGPGIVERVLTHGERRQHEIESIGGGQTSCSLRGIEAKQL